MTAIIDIVFLLIIFFLVVAHFIEAENFPVTVPDNCHASLDEDTAQKSVTLSIIRENDTCTYAVGAQKIHAPTSDQLVTRLAEQLETNLQTLPESDRTVTLRIDRDTPYAHAQHALAAIAVTGAHSIKLSALPTDQNPSTP